MVYETFDNWALPLLKDEVISLSCFWRYLAGIEIETNRMTRPYLWLLAVYSCHSLLIGTTVITLTLPTLLIILPVCAAAWKNKRRLCSSQER